MLLCLGSVTIIADHLSAKLLIIQCSQVAFVCMYVCMYVCVYVYLSYFNWVGTVSVVLPQTTNHVELVWPEGDRKIVRVQGPKWSRVQPGGNRHVKKIMWELKWSGSNPSVIDCATKRRRKQSDIAPEESKAKEKRVWQILTRYFAHFLKLFRRPLCHLHRYISSPALRTNTLYVISTCILGIFFCAKHTLRMRIPVYMYVYYVCMYVCMC